jgi:hypothetical protein
MVYTAERTKSDLAGKLSTEETTKIDTAINEVKNALASNDMAQVKVKSDALQKVLQEVGTKVYQQAAAEAAKQQGQQPGINKQVTRNRTRYRKRRTRTRTRSGEEKSRLRRL